MKQMEVPSPDSRGWALKKNGNIQVKISGRLFSFPSFGKKLPWVPGTNQHTEELQATNKSIVQANNKSHCVGNI